MKIIGAGFGRTGTLSLKAALEQLGLGPCYHMQTVIASRTHTEAWYKIAQGQPADWPALLQDFQSSVDFPASIYYRDLLEAFPEAKVIHTVRDPDRWYDSSYETIYQAAGKRMFPTWLQRGLPRAGQFIGMTDSIIWDGLFEGEFEDRRRAIEIFQRHTAEVERIVPADKLLIFEVKDGWEPLCRFLGRPVPNTPFPHANDRLAMKKQIQGVRLGFQLGPIILAAVGLTLLYQRLK